MVSAQVDLHAVWVRKSSRNDSHRWGLSKKLSDKANEVYDKLAKAFPVDYDEAGSIGKRYRREDEIGTPYCITVDFDTLEDGQVTVRDRDSMEQIRIPIDEVEQYISSKLDF